MDGIYTGFRVICLVLSGFIAAYLTVPLLSYLFGVTLTISGASLVGGMYLYIISAIIVSVGIMAALAAIILLGLGIVWLFLLAVEKFGK